MTRVLPAGRYGYEALSPGDRIDTGSVEITAKTIDAFADLTGDRFEIHIDDDAARRHGFPGRVAHGLLVLSLVDGLKNQCDAQFDAIASLGWDWQFAKPVFIGDQIKVNIAVLEIKPTSQPLRGVLTLEFDVTNQQGKTVQKGINKLMVYK